MTDWKAQARELRKRLDPGQFRLSAAEADELIAAALERAVAQEREECAQIAASELETDAPYALGPHIAERIRARGANG